MKVTHWKVEDYPTHELEQILKSVASQQVRVFGDVGLDRYTIGGVDRISPEAPVPIVRVEEEQYRLGLAANVAHNLKALGGECALLGVVGQDRVGSQIEAELKRLEIDTSLLVRDERRSILKERIMSKRHQLLRVDYEPKAAVERKTLLSLKENIRQPSEAKVAILQDYAKGTVSAEIASFFIEESQQQGKMVFADPHLNQVLALYQGADVLTPNRKEAEALLGRKLSTEEAWVESCLELQEKTKAKSIVLTLGQDGMMVAGSKEVHHLPALAQEVYDVSGAGDTVIATLALGVASGASLLASAMAANLAAGIVVRKVGTATVQVAEIQEVLRAIGQGDAGQLGKVNAPAPTFAST